MPTDSGMTQIACFGCRVTRACNPKPCEAYEEEVDDAALLLPLLLCEGETNAKLFIGPYAEAVSNAAVDFPASFTSFVRSIVFIGSACSSTQGIVKPHPEGFSPDRRLTPSFAHHHLL